MGGYWRFILDYRKYFISRTVAFSINDHVIECGDTTWQIRNIAATKIGQRKLIPKNPEPKFFEPQPTLDLNFKVLAVAFIVSILIGSSIQHEFLGFVIALAVVALIIRHKDNILKKKKSVWQARKDIVSKQQAVWQDMQKNPPVLHSLMLETNAGSKPLFYSYNEPQIKKVRDAIRESMEKKETGDVRFDIDTVNIGGEGGINNFGSEIFSQVVNEVSEHVVD